ncbi:MAG: cytidine deaminase [Candidatus Hodarchaeota archaeon]
MLRPKTVELLKEEAIKAQKNAFSPHSGFQVGAAVLTASGNVYRGCNIENDSFSLTICAERCAIFKAISEGEREIRAIAIVLPTENPESSVPCGACRQVMTQFAQELSIILVSQSGIKIMELQELFPTPFRLSSV